MGILRHRGREGHVTFKLRQDLLSIGDDYWIEDSSGNRVFRVNGKAIRWRDTWVLEDQRGEAVAKIKEKKLSVRDAITIDIGGRDAVVKKALIGIRDRYHVEVDHGEDLNAHGNFVDHEYKIERDGDAIAEVSKKWFRIRDTYGIEVFDVASAPICLAVTVAIDALSHERI